MVLFWLFPLIHAQGETLRNGPDNEYDLSIKDQKIYLRANNSQLETILKELSNRLQIRIRMMGIVDAKISGKIERDSFASFIKRVAISYAVVTSEGDPDLKIYYVLPKSNHIRQQDLEDNRYSTQVGIQEMIEMPPEAAAKAAQGGLARYLSAAISDNPTLYGFSSAMELQAAKLDDPFRVYTLDPDKLLTADLPTSLDSLVMPTNQWFFPVMAPDGTYRSILAVDQLQGNWEAVSFGSTGLSIQLDRFVDHWGALQSRQFKFVRIYQAFSDLILRRQENEVSIYPLASAVQSLKLARNNRAANFYSQEEILRALRNGLKKKKKPFESQ